MEEIGISGEKLGPNRKSPVRYTDEQVGRFEDYIRTLRKGGAKCLGRPYLAVLLPKQWFIQWQKNFVR